MIRFPGALVRWLAGYPDDVVNIVLSFVGATLAGVLAAAFVLGAAWALRGRAALRTPACARCRALLRGSGLEVPDRCSECGRSLDRPRAVLWLRFRKQALTLAITFPVVLLGGLALAIAAASYPMASLHQQATEAREAGRRTARTAQPTPPTAAAGGATGDTLGGATIGSEFSPIELLAHAPLPTLLERVWAGGEEGSSASVLAAEWADDQLRRFNDASPAEHDAILGFLADLGRGRQPQEAMLTPTPRSKLDERASLIGLVHWRDLAFRLGGAIAHNDELLAKADRLGALLLALYPPTIAWHPSSINPGQPFMVRTQVLQSIDEVQARIESIRIDGREVWPVNQPEANGGETAGPRGEPAVDLVAPVALGEHSVEVAVRAELSTGFVGGSAFLEGQRREVQRSTIAVVDGPEKVPPRSAASVVAGNEGLAPMGGFLAKNARIRAFRRTLLGSSGAIVSVLVARVGPLALQGRLELELDGVYVPIGRIESHDRGAELSALDKRPAEADGRFRVRFIPDPDLDDVTLVDPLAALASPATRGWFARDAAGVVTESFEIECTLSGGTLEQGNYRPLRPAW